MPVDWENFRHATSAADSICHLNNAGASLPPDSTVQTVIDHLLLESRIGGYEAAAQAKEACDSVYASIAKLINCDASEIAFVDSASRAWNTVVYSLNWKPGDRIVTTRTEFGSNVVTLQHICELYGAELVVLAPQRDGEINLADLEAALDERVKLVAVTHIPMHTSLIQPIEAIGRLLRGRGIFYLVDACQSVGQLSLDVKAVGCDALTATGRKWLRAPRGTGFLYVRQSASGSLNSISLDLANADWLGSLSERTAHLKIRPDAKKFELWERSIANFLGLGAAVDYLLAVGVANVEQQVASLARALRDMLSKEERIKLADFESSRTGIVSVSLHNVDHDKVKAALNTEGINLSVCHDWDAPWDFAVRNISSVLRISPHYYNSVRDLERVRDSLFAIAHRT